MLKADFISGGASGIGAESARLFVRECTKVVMADMVDAAGEKLAAELGADAAFRHVDVALPEDVKTLIDFVVDCFGRLDIMFNNARCRQSRAEISRRRSIRTQALDWCRAFGLQARLTRSRELRGRGLRQSGRCAIGVHSLGRAVEQLPAGRAPRALADRDYSANNCDTVCIDRNRRVPCGCVSSASKPNSW